MHNVICFSKTININVCLILIFPTNIFYSLSGCSTVCTTVAEAARMVRETKAQAENLWSFSFSEILGCMAFYKHYITPTPMIAYLTDTKKLVETKVWIKKVLTFWWKINWQKVVQFSLNFDIFWIVYPVKIWNLFNQIKQLFIQ